MWRAALISVCLTCCAQAQQLSYSPAPLSVDTFGAGGGFFPETAFGRSGPINLDTDYIQVGRLFRNTTSSPIFGDAFPVRTQDVFAENFGYLPLSAVLGQNPALQRQVDAIQSQVQANSIALVNIASRLDRLNARFSEGIALAGSFNVLPPNYGDRFAVSIGGAGYNGAGAASISASARIDESTIVYGGIARGPTQTMVKGGLGWSFR